MLCCFHVKHTVYVRNEHVYERSDLLAWNLAAQSVDPSGMCRCPFELAGSIKKIVVDGTSIVHVAVIAARTMMFVAFSGALVNFRVSCSLTVFVR